MRITITGRLLTVLVARVFLGFAGALGGLVSLAFLVVKLVHAK